MDWTTLAQDQDGLISRRQLLASGLTPARARRDVQNRRWQVTGRGVYATHTGPVDERARIRSALLALGPEAAASHGTALWLAGLRDQAPALVHVSVPATRHLARPVGVRVHRRRRFAGLVHPAPGLRRTTVEAAVLDVADTMSRPHAVLGLVFAATQGRFTTAGRLRHELARRARHRWRRLLHEVLDEVREGVQSPLERRYLRDVERAHGLPRGARNRSETTADGRRKYHDVRYRRWKVVVELDGRAAHPAALRYRDDARDNTAVVESGDTVLRYGWHVVSTTPCAAAAQVAIVLRRHGWRGEPQRCPRCPPPPASI